ncbi:uncharacterized protein LOC106422330 [Brassica napus]|nr:uncharacterized protein LOC106422330 [Brassica napus]
MMKGKFAGRGGGPRPNDIREAMQGDHDVHISYWKAWRSREVALDYAKGSSGASYNLLPTYLEKLVMANPGSITQIHTEYADGIGHRFKYMFMALAASIEGYRFMRKVVIVDGSHLRGKYAGCLLTASAQDGNYQVFPLAVAVVDSENDKAWEWFFTKLSQFIPNNEEIVFVSDRHPSIYMAIAKSKIGYGNSSIIRTYFKDKHLGYLVGKAARAYRLSEFYLTFNEIKRVNQSCADYLVGIGLEHWARSHFQGNRYNIMTSNVAETWNSVLRDAREYPILSLIEYIRAKLMTWFAKRRQIKRGEGQMVTPRVEEILAANFERSGSLWVTMIGEAEYKVRNKEGATFHVNLSQKTCTCHEFQALLIPCTHAIAAATRAQIRIDSLVDGCYSRSTYTAAYANIINPVVEYESIEILSSDNSVSGVEINRPSSRRPPGRPRKSRILSRGEFQTRGPKKRTVCSRCKGGGHNRATCKVAI